MAGITVPNTFVNNTQIADATQVNANFQAILTGLVNGANDFVFANLVINSALSANGPANLTSSVSFTNTATFGGSLVANAATQINSSVSFANTATFSALVNAGGGVQVTGGSAATGGFWFSGNQLIGRAGSSGFVLQNSSGNTTTSVASTGAHTFGFAQAANVTHAFYKDVNAGDTTTSVFVTLGNSGSNQGSARLAFTNAAATGSPASRWQVFFRNNANSTLIDGGQITFQKVSGADNSFCVISIADTTGTARANLSLEYNSSTRADLILNGAGTANLDSVIRRGAATGSLRISAGSGLPSATGGNGIEIYASSHASTPNISRFYNNATLWLETNANGKPVFQTGIAHLRTDVTSTATINAMSSASGFAYLTGSTATQINGISSTSVADGQMIVIINRTGANLTLANLNGSASSADQIETGTGADVVTTGNGAALLMYSSTATKWILVSYQG